MTDMRERLAEILVGYVDSYMGFASKKDMQDRALEAADAVIAARWHDTPATPSGAQQVTDEMVEAALAEFIEQDWPRDQSDENAECLRSDMRAALEAAIAVRAIASVAQQLPLSKAGNRQAPCIPMRYTNYRGETAIRHIIPLRVWWGSTEWHPEPDWLLESVDVEKCATRDFALSDADFRTLSAPSPDIHPPCPEGWAAPRMIFEAVGELFGPVASLESEEAMLLRGPEMPHAAEAVIEALQRVQSSTAPSPEAIRAQAIEEAALDALRAYQQADEEGVMVLVSREALDMAIRALSPLPSGARVVVIPAAGSDDKYALVEKIEEAIQAAVSEVILTDRQNPHLGAAVSIKACSAALRALTEGEKP